jgi:hypothetical protein
MMRECISLDTVIGKLLEELIGAGMTEAQIGMKIGRDQSSVNRMRNGKQRPDYETGVKIVDLHRKRCASGRGRAAA